ncbi:MAG: DUF5777 family beta-barrel protein [Gemmatimonadota bacterium]|nr:DUF5777 family beta-barrel protein [Gemmatimonadota bacterium]MDH5803533.1 DUF5777 family beta-barrel protein [Gemmatimonadota bacterium]
MNLSYRCTVCALSFALTLTTFPSLANAQDRPTRWSRQRETVQLDVETFHSTQSITLPTSQTIGKSEFEFEISHRFFPPLSSGPKGLWGLDGPVLMRLGLSYGITDRMTVTLARSNRADNIDLQGKFRLPGIRSENFPLTFAVQAGLAWNTEVPGRVAGDNRNIQYYGQFIFNGLVNDVVAVGLVPSYLHNVDVNTDVSETNVSLGGYVHFYATEVLALIGEWNASPSRTGFENNTAGLGFQLETGGHFFKVIVTNSPNINPSQYLPGTPDPFSADNLRLGFNITRVLH